MFRAHSGEPSLCLFAPKTTFFFLFLEWAKSCVYSSQGNSARPNVTRKSIQMAASCSFVTKSLNYSVHLPVSKKAPILMICVLLLSALSALELSPHSPSLADKNNVFNSLLVKWSWGWSLLCLLPTVTLTASLYTGLRWKEVLGHLARLAVAHCIWFLVTNAFVFVDSALGTCSDGSGSGRRECVQGKGSWHGFDISGHVFLLTYCVYVLTEEVAGLRWEVWGTYMESLGRQERIVSKLSLAHEQLPYIHLTCTPVAHGLELFAAALMTIWIAMTMTTSLYFHSLPEKVLGGLLSFLAWLLTYGWLYGRKGAPHNPSHGFLSPFTHSQR